MANKLLPNHERAVVDTKKLQNYVLNPEHPEGQHKAFVFLSVLGIGPDDADDLKELIIEAIKQTVAVPKHEDQYGKRFSVTFVCTRNGRTASIKTAWIIRTGEDIARLTSCYID